MPTPWLPSETPDKYTRTKVLAASMLSKRANDADWLLWTPLLVGSAGGGLLGLYRAFQRRKEDKKHTWGDFIQDVLTPTLRGVILGGSLGAALYSAAQKSQQERNQRSKPPDLKYPTTDPQVERNIQMLSERLKKSQRQSPQDTTWQKRSAAYPLIKRALATETIRPYLPWILAGAGGGGLLGLILGLQNDANRQEASLGFHTDDSARSDTSPNVFSSVLAGALLGGLGGAGLKKLVDIVHPKTPGNFGTKLTIQEPTTPPLSKDDAERISQHVQQLWETSPKLQRMGYGRVPHPENPLVRVSVERYQATPESLLQPFYRKYLSENRKSMDDLIARKKQLSELVEKPEFLQALGVPKDKVQAFVENYRQIFPKPDYTRLSQYYPVYVGNFGPSEFRAWTLVRLPSLQPEFFFNDTGFGTRSRLPNTQREIRLHPLTAAHEATHAYTLGDRPYAKLPLSKTFLRAVQEQLGPLDPSLLNYFAGSHEAEAYLMQASRLYTAMTGRVVDSPEKAMEALHMFRNIELLAPPAKLWTQDIPDDAKLMLLLRLMELVRKEKPTTSGRPPVMIS